MSLSASVCTMDVVVVLGARIDYSESTCTWVPSTHLRQRLDAAARAYRQRGESDRALVLVLTGGFNVGVRYDKAGLLAVADFGPRTVSAARWLAPSEAMVMSDYLVARGVPEGAMVLEESSATTKENALFVAVLLQRWQCQSVTLLTSASHMERALADFERAGVTCRPLVADADE